MKTISSVAANTLVLAVTLLNAGTAAAFTVSPLQASRVQYPTLAGRAARPQWSVIAMAAGSTSQVREQESSILTTSMHRLKDPARAHTI